MAFNKPLSRNEAILQNMLGADNELEAPQSRIEELLQEILNSGGGGGGTNNYTVLHNKPKVNNRELIGNKTSDDLGLQDKLTAGNNITIENNVISASEKTVDGEMSDSSANAVENKVIKSYVDYWLEHKADKSTTYTKEEVKALILDELEKYEHLDFVKVRELPEVGEEDVRYMLYVSDSSERGYHFEEYMYMDNDWVDIGDANSINLENYYDKFETDTLLLAKQDTLVSGENIKTINGESLLGSGNKEVIEKFKLQNVELPVTDGIVNMPAQVSSLTRTQYQFKAYNVNGIQDGVLTISKKSSGHMGMLGWDVQKQEVVFDDDLPNVEYVDAADTALQEQVDVALDKFRLRDFSGSDYNVTIPMVTEEIVNTQIPAIDLKITGTEAENYKILGMISYEMFDANNNRINCFPVCQFTQNNQTLLRVRMMCGGTSRKTIKRVSCKLLLLHR